LTGRSVREPYDLWHPPEDFTTRFSFLHGVLQIHREKKPFADIPPQLVGCSRCPTMEKGEIVYIIEAFGPAAGTIRFQMVRQMLTPAQELSKQKSLWELGEGLRQLLGERTEYAFATAFAPTDSEGWE
jgi:hypothetical protein